MREEMIALWKYFKSVTPAPNHDNLSDAPADDCGATASVNDRGAAASAHPSTSAARTAAIDQRELRSTGRGQLGLVHKDFGYRWMSWLPIVEWGIDYGDGNQYAAHDEGSARDDVYWHKYQSPGSYPVRAWVIDSAGRRTEAACTFTWLDGGWSNPVPDNGSPDYPSGDLDCEDIGHQVWVGNYDPNGLDGDGDGWGCDGW